MTQSHHAAVSAQFSPRAAAYVASPVHASGPDLDELAEAVAGRGRLLDLGCGGGHAAFAAAPRVDAVIAYDLSPAMLAAVAAEAARRGLSNIATHQGAVERLPFPAAAFDAVVTRLSAHHWSDVRAALGEMRRVLKPGGIAVVIDAVAPPSAVADTWLQSIELLRDPSHVRDYSIREWQALLADTGFALSRTTERRLRLDFASWIARMEPPAVHVAAIRSLHAAMPAEIAARLGLEPDGSFMLDTATFVAA